MAMISNAPQPVSCTAFSTAGMAAPRVPRAGLSEPMAERPVSAPTTPAAASSSTPSTEPVTDRRQRRAQAQARNQEGPGLAAPAGRCPG